MNEPDQYFTVCIRIERTEYFLIWVSSETDRLVLSPTNRLAVFPDIGELMGFAVEKGLVIQSEKPPIYDFDALVEWMKEPDSRNIDCEFFLNAWNMLGDIEVSFGKKLKEPDGASTVYDKLFYGNNLPPVTPEGEHYIPEWSEDEIVIMVSVFEAGLKTLHEGIEYAT